MQIFRTNAALHRFLSENTNQTVGFVPTMGALHQGHISLIERCKAENDITICSIFVNPTQFNNADDLKKYPRTEETDAALLKTAKCDVLYLPSVEEIYPVGLVTPEFDLGGLDNMMEGAHRPGHFKGVVQVVHRLLTLVHPNTLYMGQKDLQQFTIIRKMLSQMANAPELIVCPIIREVDGLAMSSRNVRIKLEDRPSASIISKVLLAATKPQIAEDLKHGQPFSTPEEYCSWAMNLLSDQPNMKPEYVEMVYLDTLLPVTNWQSAKAKAICVATWLGDVRLIDNILLA